MERLKFEETNPKEREPETKIETYSERAIRIERPDAVFRIIYEIHDNLYQLEDFKNIDALAIEFVYDTKTKPEEISDNYFYQTVERLDLKNFLETNRTPIYFIDAVDSEEKLEKLVNTGMLLSVLEGTAGLYLGGSALSNAVEKIRGRKNFTRRDFLKTLIKGVAGAYFSLPFLQQLIGSWEARTRQIFEEGSKKRQIFKSLTNINEKSHPEIYAFMTTLRNQIWAQKLDYLASKIPHQSNRKPEIGILVGRGHSGLENAIGENPKQRLDFLKRFLKLNPINISDIQLSKILHFEYNPYPDEATVRKRIKYPTYVTESDGSVHTQGIWELKEIIDEPLLKEEVQ